jgi:hypothetical protein
MTEVIYISPEAHEIAKIVAEYGPKWGFDVPRGVDIMAQAKPAPPGTIIEDEDLGQLVNELSVEVKGLPEATQKSKVVDLVAALQRSVERHRLSPVPVDRSGAVDDSEPQMDGGATGRESDTGLGVAEGAT